jgi:hypothetical protein
MPKKGLCVRKKLAAGKVKIGLVERICNSLRKYAVYKPRCKFYRYCPSCREESYTCNSGGGNYCGIYRCLQYRGRDIIQITHREYAQ